MKDTERRRLETFERVKVFGDERAAQFTPDTFAGEQFTVLAQVLAELQTHASAQVAGRSAVRQGASGKAAARDELMRDLEAISRTARPMSAQTPGLAEQFRIPHHQNNQGVVAAARAVVAAALPLKAEFIKRGLRSNFLEDLLADINALEEADTQKLQGRESHVTATAAIDDLIERGMQAVRELDPVMRNTFADDAANLAAWMSACRVERSPRADRPRSETLPAPGPLQSVPPPGSTGGR